MKVPQEKEFPRFRYHSCCSEFLKKEEEKKKEEEGEEDEEEEGEEEEKGEEGKKWVMRKMKGKRRK
jgi:hypothetical protein